MPPSGEREPGYRHPHTKRWVASASGSLMLVVTLMANSQSGDAKPWPYPNGPAPATPIDRPKPEVPTSPAGCPGNESLPLKPGTRCPDGRFLLLDVTLPAGCPGSANLGEPQVPLQCPERPGRPAVIII